MSIIQGTAKPTSGDASFYTFPIDQSLRITPNGYLSQSANAGGYDFGLKLVSGSYPNSPFSFSAWVKRNNLGVRTPIINFCDSTSNNSDFTTFGFEADDTLRLISKGAGDNIDAVASVYNTTTNIKFRDTSAWYHLVFTVAGKADNYLKIYVNGTELSVDYDDGSNLSPLQRVDNGARFIGVQNSNYGSFYIAEFNLVDGILLNQNYFGEQKNNVWSSKAYDGTSSNGSETDYSVASNRASLVGSIDNIHGPNGSHLSFASSTFNSSTSKFIDDSSSNNASDWTVN